MDSAVRRIGARSRGEKMKRSPPSVFSLSLRKKRSHEGEPKQAPG